MIDQNINSYFNNEKVNGDFSGYNLDNIQKILELLGNPQNELFIIHIAGTNGKGSSAQFINDITTTAGIKTGLFTSPHLLNINERIMINNVMVTDQIFNKLFHKIDSLCRQHKIDLTFFDLLTAMTLKYFHDEKCQIAIMETGLGGRLDSTNVVNSQISIITEISYDHMHILGTTIEAITKEKSGIIKKNSTVITTNKERKINRILSKKCREQNSSFLKIGRDYKIKNIIQDNLSIRFDYIDKDISLYNILLNSINPKLVQNAATAIMAAHLLTEMNFKIKISDIYYALESFNMKGRFEILSKDPLIIFDVAHNKAAVKNSLKMIKNFQKTHKIITIFSLMQDKDYKTIIESIEANQKSNIYFIELYDTRALKKDMIINDYKNLNFLSKYEQLITLFENNSSNKNILFYFIGTFRLYEMALKLKEYSATNKINR